MADLDFIEELDKSLSNVGTDIFWNRKIGALDLWLSPLSITGQEKVTTAIGKAELGTNIVGESKRVTLANSIVGVNKHDLRQYRGGAPAFPSKNREGKVVNVPLEQYLYNKMSNWSAQYVDDVFEVYADLMETFQKQNLKEIKFENAKDPHIELIELERRTSALRAQLGLPPLVEKGDDSDKEELEPTPEEVASMLEAEREREPQEQQRSENPEDFDPFKPRDPADNPHAPPVQAAAPQPPQQPPPPSAQPSPNMTMPAVLPEKLRRSIPGLQPRESSPENPLVATPSVPQEPMIRKQRPPFEIPKVDPAPSNRNPRFSPPR